MFKKFFKTDQTHALIEYVKGRYAISEISPKSEECLKSIAEQGEDQIKYFQDCLELLRQAKLVRNFKRRSDKKTVEEKYIPNLQWLMQVSVQQTASEQIHGILSTLHAHHLLNQSALDKLQKGQHNRFGLLLLKEVVLLVHEKRKTLDRNQLQFIMKNALLLDTQSLLGVTSLLKINDEDVDFFQRSLRELLSRKIVEVSSQKQNNINLEAYINKFSSIDTMSRESQKQHARSFLHDRDEAIASVFHDLNKVETQHIINIIATIRNNTPTSLSEYVDYTLQLNDIIKRLQSIENTAEEDKITHQYRVRQKDQISEERNNDQFESAASRHSLV